MRTLQKEIIHQVAKEAAEKITSRVVKDLQQVNEKLSGDDSGLNSLWDEVCVQVQAEKFFSWDLYEQMIKARIEHHVHQISNHERKALWLKTAAGSDWATDENQLLEPIIMVDELVQCLFEDHLLARAEAYANSRIQSYLNRSYID